MLIKGVCHIFGKGNEAVQAIKDAKLTGYIKDDQADEFLKNNPGLDVVKTPAECF